MFVFRTFTAEILILYHSTSVQLNYQPVVHIGTVRQAARLTSMTGKRVLRTGERATCHFTFMYRPEYIKSGARLIFREGRTKGVGKIMSANEDGLGPQPRVQTETELAAKHAEVSTTAMRLVHLPCRLLPRCASRGIWCYVDVLNRWVALPLCVV